MLEELVPTLYNTPILPLFDYGDIVLGGGGGGELTTMMSELQVLQNKAAKVLLGYPPQSSSTEALKSLDPLYEMIFPSLHFKPQISYWGN